MRITGVAVIAAAVVLAAGCGGGGDEGPTLPPVTAPPMTSAVPTPSVSAFPDTPQGAADFARFLYGEINRAFEDKDPDRLRPLFASDCAACTRYLSTLEQLRSGSATVDRGKAVLLGAESPGGPGPRVVVVRERADKVTFRDAQGRVTAVEPAGEYVSDYKLIRAGASYQLAGQTIVKS